MAQDHKRSKLSSSIKNKIAQIQNSDKKFLIGADEVGYGAWSGPVFVCAVKAAKDWQIDGLRDSKKLSPKKRMELREKLLKEASDKKIEFAFASRTSQEIDFLGLGVATKQCYIDLFEKFYDGNSLLIADGIFNFDKIMGNGYTGIALIKADDTIPVVMAAAILAKTTRDAIMEKLSKDYSNYGWEGNKGYPSPEHIKAIKKHGVSPYHRLSYKPLQKYQQK